MADDVSAPPRKKKKLLKKAIGDAPSSGSRASSEDSGEEGGGGKGNAKIKIIIIAAAAGVLLLGLGLGIGLFAAGMFSDGGDPQTEETASAEDEPEEMEEEVEERDSREKRHSIYVSVGKLLATVEHNGATRYIQAEMDLVGYNKEVMDDAQHDMPAIRNRLLLLFASQNFDEVRTVEGREALRAASIKAVNEVLGFGPRGDKVEDAYFTAFVLQ